MKGLHYSFHIPYGRRPLFPELRLSLCPCQSSSLRSRFQNAMRKEGPRCSPTSGLRTAVIRPVADKCVVASVGNFSASSGFNSCSKLSRTSSPQENISGIALRTHSCAFAQGQGLHPAARHWWWISLSGLTVPAYQSGALVSLCSRRTMKREFLILHPILWQAAVSLVVILAVIGLLTIYVTFFGWLYYK